MRTWLRSVLDEILEGYGKTNPVTPRPAWSWTPNLTSASSRGLRLRLEGAREDRHLFKPVGASADDCLFQQLVRIRSEAQDPEAKDERWLYDPLSRARPSFLQTERLDRGSRF